MNKPSPLPSSTQTGADSAAVVAERAIEEFISLCRVPHPSYHTEKMLAYLQSWADRHGLHHERDEYGNIWIDAPASAGCEHLPKVILQGHMDMVCVANASKEIDFINEPITPVLDRENSRLTAEDTSLGADDGAGVAVALALITSKMPHGPLRALITADEEVGMLGAKALDERALDCDYLINFDNEHAGTMCYSSAGSLRAKVNKTLPTEALRDDDVAYTLSLRELLSGHSGVEIDQHRLHAALYGMELLQKMIDQGLDCRLSAAKIGFVTNVIPTGGKIDIVMPKDQAAKATVLFEEFNAQKRAEYPEERNMMVTFSPSSTRPNTALSLRDTQELAQFITGLPQGVIQMKSPEVVRFSSNIGIVSLENGACSISTGTRSCVDSDLKEYESQYQAKAEKQGFEYVRIQLSPGWDGDTTEKLTQLIKEGFDCAAGLPARMVSLHGGIELTWFVKKRPTMQMVCIGPTMENVHSVREVLHLDSLKPLVAAVMYALENIGK